MRFITALATLALAGAANAAFTPFTRDKLPTEPGFLHFRNAECSYADGDEGGFIPFSVLPPCSGGCGPCLGTSVFRSVIAYSPHNHTLPYDVYVDRTYSSPCGNITGPTAVKLNVTNKCIKLNDDSNDDITKEFELFFIDPEPAPKN